MSKIVEITLDFETYYSKKEKYSLSAKGGYEKYIRNPKFEIIGLAVKEFNRPAQWLAPHEIQDWIDYVAGAYGWENVRVIAHNGRFDMAILGWIYNVYPYQVADTMLMSRACQLWDGHSLDNVTKQLRECYRWGVVKNERGETMWGIFDLKDLPDTLDKGKEVHNADGKHLMDFTAEEYYAYGGYAMGDVDLTYSAYQWFMTQRKFPEKEIDVMTLTIEMFTYPVIELHKPVLLEVEKEVNGKRQALLDKVGATVEDLRSDANFAQMLINLGVTPPMKLNAKGEKKYAFAKKDLAFLKLLEHEDPNVVELVEARLGNKSSQAVTRVQSLLELADRGLMPIPLEYYAAHTGRWGGCLVADTRVICATKSGSVGEKRIIEVKDDDLVWDGEEFVSHDGVKYRGHREVISYQGVTGTRNHPVFINYHQTLTLEEAMVLGVSIQSCSLPSNVTITVDNTKTYNATEDVYDIVNCGPRHRFWANGKLVHNSDGVNLQNFNRNQLVTSDTPTGTKVFYADKADVVVGVLPDGNVHLARAGVVKNEEELLHVMGLRDALKAPKGKKLVVFDLSQVECVSGDGFVLTNNGLKKICEISTSDLVFDGVEYVKHDGVMFKGVKDVIEYCGVVGTPDHIVYTRSGEPITLDQAAFSKAELCTGGAEWDKVWEMGGFKQTNTINDTDDQSLVSMPMWFGASSCDKRPKKRKIHRLSQVWERTRESLRRLTRETSQSVASEIQGVAGACESEQVHQQNLCERGEQVHQLRRICPLYVEHRSERRLHRVGARPYRHKRTLRKGKSTFRNKSAKCTNPQVQRYGGVQRGFNVSVNVRPSVCAGLSLRYGEQKNTQGLNTRSDYFREPTTKTRMVGVQGCKNDPNTIRSPIQQRKGAVQPLSESDSNTRFTELGNVIAGTIPVYDIINCGSRHRFCYNGVIVSNCRANAWEWGEQWVLDALVSGKDIYKVTAASTYGVAYDDVTKSQRFVGKSQQLGLGYGAGVNGLKVVMGQRCEEFTDDELQGFVNAYRAAAPNIVRGWKQCKSALGAMVSGVQIQFCKADILYTDGQRIALPNGLHLTYRDIHTRPGEIGNEFWFWGKNKQTKKPDWEKTFAGKIDENCIAEDTEVLTDRGWVKIQDVKLTDKVHDGVEFVTHKGILFKSVKECVNIDGVYMTTDHEVLTNDGWKQAGVLLSERSTSSIQRLDRATLRELGCTGKSKAQTNLVLALPMRLWQNLRKRSAGRKEITETKQYSELWLSFAQADKREEQNARNGETSYLCDMAFNEATLYATEPQSVAQLRRSGYNSLSEMVRQFRELSRRYVPYISERFGFRPNKQRWELRTNELQMGRSQVKLSEQTKIEMDRYARRNKVKPNGLLSKVWDRAYNCFISVSGGGENATTRREAGPKKPVYDILDCGKRNRFVVGGDTEPFIVHNCTQALCRIIMADIMLAIREDFHKREWTRDDAHICLTVHDEVIVCCKDELAEEVSEIMQYQMKKSRDWYSDLPLNCDGDIAQRYGAAK